MSNLQSILEVLLFIFALSILLLSIFAYFNKNPENNKNDMHSLDFLWIFHEEYYNEYGKSACRMGRKITFIGIIVFIVWLIFKTNLLN